MVNQSIIEIAKKYIYLLPESIKLKKAFLFGSYAKGLEKTDSDIDIAIVVEKIEDFFALQILLMRLRIQIDLRIEPHPICINDFNIQNPFAYQIQETGIEIF